MKKGLLLGLAVLLFAAPAGAHSKHAKVSTAKLEATDASSAVRGRAQLVDGRKRDKVSLHMKGLAPGETYLWHVHQATGEGDPCAEGSAVADPAWTYRALVARESGNASSKGKSTTFSAKSGDFYVDVHLEDGTVIACGVLERKRHKHGHHGHDDRPGHDRGRGHDRDGD